MTFGPQFKKQNNQKLKLQPYEKDYLHRPIVICI
jgi:hypothetical protein